MITFQPLKHYYEDFVELNISKYNRKTGGYVVQDDMVFILPKLNLLDYKDVHNRYKIKTIGNFTEFTVYQGLWFDGATMAIDYDSRMMFALLHDIACWVTHEVRDHSYRDALNDLAYKIVTAQNGYWFNGLAVKRGVTRYSKRMKRKGEF